MKRRKQNHKISFHFFAAPPCTPRLLNGLVRKFLVLYASGRSARRADVGVTTLSERKIKFRITTRSARAKLIKILRILFVKSSNFVQETPQTKQKLPAYRRLFVLLSVGIWNGRDLNPKGGFENSHRLFRRRTDSETAPLGVKGLRPGINPSLSAKPCRKAGFWLSYFCGL